MPLSEGVAFVNAQEKHKKYPETFQVPTAEELASVVEGDFVKVCAEGERFWIEVEKIDCDTYTGRIDNDLMFTDNHGLTCDEVIEVKREHVIDVYAI